MVIMIMMLTLKLISKLPTFANHWVTARSIFMSSQWVRLSVGDWDLWVGRGRFLSGEPHQFPVAFYPQVWRSVTGQNVWRATSWLWRVAPLLYCSSSRWSVRGKNSQHLYVGRRDAPCISTLTRSRQGTQPHRHLRSTAGVGFGDTGGWFCFLENRAL